MMAGMLVDHTGMSPTAPISVISAPPTGQTNANQEGEISTMDALLLGRTRVSTYYYVTVYNTLNLLKTCQILTL